MGTRMRMPAGTIKASDEVEALLKGAKIDVMDERWRHVNDLYGKVIKLRMFQEQENVRRKEIVSIEKGQTARAKDIKMKESSIIWYLKEIRKDQGLPDLST